MVQFENQRIRASLQRCRSTGKCQRLQPLGFRLHSQRLKPLSTCSLACLKACPDTNLFQIAPLPERTAPYPESINVLVLLGPSTGRGGPR